jgi:signal transduction histidine kinase/ligand-binding sensor domain-containing protein
MLVLTESMNAATSFFMPPRRWVWAGLGVLLQAFLLAGELPAEPVYPEKNPEYVIAHWSVQDGLPSARINDVVQTRDGYLWLATLNGLARFDGVRFERFSETDTPGLVSRLISCLFEDAQGRLWYGTEMGQIGWKDASGFHSLPLPKDVMHGRVVRLIQTINGVVWAMSRTVLLPITDAVAGTPLETRPGESRIWDMTAGQKGALWLLSEGGQIGLFNSTNVVPYPLLPGGGGGGWRNILGARAGGVWVLDGEHLRRYDQGRWVEDRSPVPQAPSADSVLCERADGTVVIGTYGEGLVLVDAAGQAVQLNHQDGLSSDQVLSLCEDREANLWVGTAHGLNRITPRVVKIIKPTGNWDNRTVTSVAAASQGGVWVGTEGAGLFHVDSEGKVLWHQSNGVWPRDYLRCVLEDHAGRVWLGLFGHGLRVKDEAHSAGMNVGAMNATTINALFEDSRSNIWLGTSHGAARLPPGAGRFSPPVLANQDVRCFAEGQDGTIWMGTEGGGLFRHARGQTTNIPAPAGFKMDIIHALQVTDDDALWIGTWGNGLLRWAHGDWLHLGHAEGVPSDSISDIQSDAAGNLWVGSSSGLFEIRSERLHQFSTRRPGPLNLLQLGYNDGLESLEIPSGMQPTTCRTADGRLWYVTAAGLALLNPGAIKPNTVKPPVAIEEFVCDGETLFSNLRPVVSGRAGAIQCPPGARELKLRYTALSLMAPSQVRFRYRLLGLDDRWIEAGDRRVAYFSHVPPGNYTFQVIACNNQGVWNEKGASLPFSVLPAFWQTVWFKLAMGGLIVAGLLTAHRLRTGRLRALERLRHRIARDLHDDVGANLGSISLLTEVMEQHPQPGDLARIRRTANETVDTLRDLVWIINPAHEHLSDLVARLRQIAAIMLENLSYRFEDDKLPASLKLSLELRRNLPPVFKEALHNILKHAHARQVNIRLACQDGKLLLEIQDDGVGFDSAVATPGNGLKNFRNRAAEMSARLTVQSRPGRGTTVRLIAPITRSRDWRRLFK